MRFATSHEVIFRIKATQIKTDLISFLPSMAWSCTQLNLTKHMTDDAAYGLLLSEGNSTMGGIAL